MKNRNSMFIYVVVTIMLGLIYSPVAAVQANGLYSYSMVDLSESANSKAYLNSTNYSSVTIDSNNDFISWGGETYRHNFALDRDSFSSLMTNGVLYDQQGVPYSILPEKAIAIRGNYDLNYSPSVLVDVKNGAYEKVHFLAYSMVGSSNFSSFKVQIIYDDGTSTDNQVALQPFNNDDSPSVAAKVKYYAHWQANMNLGTTITGGFNLSADTTSVYTYSVTPTAGKIVDKIVFRNESNNYGSWYEIAKVLAVSLAENGAEYFIENYLTDAVNVTQSNFMVAYKQFKLIDEKMVLQGITANDLGATAKTKYLAVKEAVASYKNQNSYSTVDISGVANSKAYLNSTNYTSVSIDSNNDFFSWGGDTYRHNLALDRDSFSSQMIDNVLYDQQGVPYSILPEKAIAIRGNNIIDYSPSVTVDMPNGTYNKIHFLAYSLVGSSNFNAFRAKIDYSDGSSSITPVAIMPMGSAEDGPNVVAKVNTYAHWNGNMNLGSTITSFSPSIMTSVYTYSVTPEAGKTVDTVTFYNEGNNYGNWYELSKVLAVTLEGYGVDYYIQQLPAVESISKENLVEVKNQLDKIEEIMAAQGITNADLAEALRTKLISTIDAVNVITAAMSELAVDSFTLTQDDVSLGNNKSIVATSAQLYNYTDAAKDAVLVLAVYNGDKLIAVSVVQSGDVASLGNSPISTQIEVDNFASMENGSSTAFILKDMTSLKPLCTSFKKKVSYNGTIPATSGLIKYTGRWEPTGDAMVSYWGGAYFDVVFTGTTAKIQLKASDAVSLYAEIDGVSTYYNEVSGLVDLTPGVLNEGEHTLRVISKNLYENINLQSIVLDEHATILPISQVKPLIEFIGDSITAGTGETEVDAKTSYAWIASEELGCDRVLVAQPGITLVADPTYFYSEGMIKQYFKLNYQKTSNDYVNWAFPRYSPDIIVINIGTNDQIRNNAGGNISESDFATGLTSFLAQVRTRRPNAEIFVMRTLGGYMQNPTMTTVNGLVSSGDQRLHYVDTTGWLNSADYYDSLHPTQIGHQKVVVNLKTVIAPYLQ